MSETAPQVVRSYLSQLERALSGVSVEMRDEIVAGVAEELSGLAAVQAAQRIEELGDPEFIAAEARAEAGGAAAAATSRDEAGAREPAWYPVLAALLIAIGGLVVPVIGWVVGLAMVWFSKTWTRGEKLVTVITPVLALAATTLITLLSRWAQHEDALGATSGSQPSNPLMPAPFDIVWSGVFLFGGVNVVVGIWLLWRAKRN